MQLNQHVDCLECSICPFANAIRYVRYAPAIQVVLARNILFAFFISVIPALMPVVGLKELHLQPGSLGLLFTSMGAGSVFGAVFVLPWTRQRLSSDSPGKFPCRAGLSAHGICAATVNLHDCRSPGRDWMDSRFI